MFAPEPHKRFLVLLGTHERFSAVADDHHSFTRTHSLALLQELLLNTTVRLLLLGKRCIHPPELDKKNVRNLKDSAFKSTSKIHEAHGHCCFIRRLQQCAESNKEAAYIYI
jgi:hypothetical protein